LTNMRVLQYLAKELGQSEDARNDWYRHWIRDGFDALETLLAGSTETGSYCQGAAPGLADVLLVPQVYNARRYECDLAPYPTITRIEQACNALPVFDRARPER